MTCVQSSQWINIEQFVDLIYRISNDSQIYIDNADNVCKAKSTNVLHVPHPILLPILR